MDFERHHRVIKFDPCKTSIEIEKDLKDLGHQILSEIRSVTQSQEMLSQYIEDASKNEPDLVNMIYESSEELQNIDKKINSDLSELVE